MPVIDYIPQPNHTLAPTHLLFNNAVCVPNRLQMLESLLRRWRFDARLDDTDDRLWLDDRPCRRKTTSLSDVKGCFAVGGRGLVDVRPTADFVVCLTRLAFTIAQRLIALKSPKLAVGALPTLC